MGEECLKRSLLQASVNCLWTAIPFLMTTKKASLFDSYSSHYMPYIIVLNVLLKALAWHVGSVNSCSPGELLIYFWHLTHTIYAEWCLTTVCEMMMMMTITIHNISWRNKIGFSQYALALENELTKSHIVERNICNKNNEGFYKWC